MAVSKTDLQHVKDVLISGNRVPGIQEAVDTIDKLLDMLAEPLREEAEPKLEYEARLLRNSMLLTALGMDLNKHPVLILQQDCETGRTPGLESVALFSELSPGDLFMVIGSGERRWFKAIEHPVVDSQGYLGIKAEVVDIEDFAGKGAQQ